MILILNHLWQSTLAVLVAALLAFALRRHRAQVRYWLWLAASAKFLVPFALLVTLGNQFAWRTSPAGADSAASVVIDAISQPFSPAANGPAARVSPAVAATRTVDLWPFVVGIWLAGSGAVLFTWWVRWRRITAIVLDSAPIDAGREVDILRRLESSETHGRRQAPPLTLVASDDSLEPGVFGIRRPVLLWPRSISARLTDEQIEAILAHELAHVRRRDNLAAAIHMAAQSFFWFHPMVWWIGSRLVDERERACDDEVLRRGSTPQIYAESILKTCEFCVESPITCVSGVTGSDLKKRIEDIMRREAALTLTGWRRALLVTVAVGAIAGPIAAGAIAASPIGRQVSGDAGGSQRLGVVLVKQNGSGRNGMTGGGSFPGQFVYSNVTLRSLISNAYGASLQPLSRDQLVGAPEWIDSDHFDVVVKADGNLQRFAEGNLQRLVDAGPGRPTESPLLSTVRNLLAERFNFVAHREVRDLPVYELVMARDGDEPGRQLRKSAADCTLTAGQRGTRPPPPPPAPRPGDRPMCGIRLLAGNISAGGVTMAQFASALSRIVGRSVVDQTGLIGPFDLDLQWTPDRTPPGPRPAVPFQPPADPNAVPGGSSIVAALQAQLGVRLNPQTSPVDVVVVDHLEKLNQADEFETPALAPPPPPPPPPER